VEPQQVLKKPGIICFNCGKEGHFQSACTSPAHCSLCDVDGHTTGMCPELPSNRRCSGTAMQWMESGSTV
jgi:hypothetical protein